MTAVVSTTPERPCSAYITMFTGTPKDKQQNSKSRLSAVCMTKISKRPS